MNHHAATRARRCPRGDFILRRATSHSRARALLRRLPLLLVVVLLPALLIATSAAAQTATVGVQGALRASGGGPVADGDYLLEFSLWDAAKAGKSMWKEGPFAAQVKNGLFSIVLGNQAKLTPSLFTKGAWLQVKVGTEAPLARTPIRAVPWSMRASLAAGLACKGCVGTEQLANAAVKATQVAFPYAGAADGIKGGAAVKAKLAENLQCTGCVSASKEIKWDGDIDLKTRSLKAAKVSAGKVTSSGDVVAAGAVAAKTFIGDGSKLTGIKTAAGQCSKKGEVVKGIAADGSLVCVAAMNPAALPADGLDEISNGLLSNQFIDEKAIAKPVPISDNSPLGTSSVIDFPDIGLAQQIWISVELKNSDIRYVQLELKDPLGKTFVLKGKGSGKKGDGIKTSWPQPTKTVSGDLTSWHGKNPKGKWTLKVTDSVFLNNKLDGELTRWSVKIRTLSNHKVAIKGRVIGGVQLKNSDTDPLPCNAQTAGYMYFSPKQKLMKVCNGEQYFPVALTVVGTEASPGVSCKHILSLVPSAKTGLYFIDPDGPGGVSKMQVLCDMDTLGGGWTMVLHTYYTGNLTPTSQYKQKFAAWEDIGIGKASDVKSVTTNSHYFMPLKWWKELSSSASELRIQGQNAVNAGTIKNYKMNAKYGLDGSNEKEISNNFCNGNSNCFIYAPGFSAIDKDNDSYGPKCADSYGNSGWWYAHCFHYNPHYQTGNKGHFASHVKADSKSNYWTWWVR